MNWIVLIMVGIYMILILGIGLYSSRKIKNTSDYVVAGRQLKTPILTGTLAATALGGSATLGVVGNAYGRWGFSAFWYVAAMGISFLLIGWIAPMYRTSGAKTVPEYFRMRYGKTAGLIQSLLTMISMIGLIAAQLKASATVIEVMGGVDYNTALVIVSFVLATYSILGGFWGIALTDVIQLILTIVGMTAAIPFALHLANGWGHALQALPEGTLSLTTGIGGWYEIIAYMILFVTSYAVGEEVVSSYYAADSASTARKGSLFAGMIVLAFSVIPVVLGILMKAAYEMGQLGAGVIAALDQDAKYALPALAVSSMPEFIIGILFIGILAATMSSADSALLGAASVFGNDIYRIHINPGVKTEKLISVARLSVVFVILASFFTAIYSGNILVLLASSLALRSVGSFVPYIMSFFWKQPSALGCNLSMILSTGVFVVLNLGGMTSSSARAIYPALGISLAVVFSVEGLTRLFRWGRREIE